MRIAGKLISALGTYKVSYTYSVLYDDGSASTHKAKLYTHIQRRQVNGCVVGDR